MTTTAFPAASMSVPQKTVSLSSDSYAFLQQYIQSESGITIEEDKQYLLEARLSPIFKSYGLESLDGLTLALKSRNFPELRRSVIEAMTTHETLFFRDGGLFEAIKTSVLPKLATVISGTRPLRIWSAAASSGQEAYSMSMLLLEFGIAPCAFEIVGTDLSTRILDRARTGRYGQFEVSRGLPSNLLLKYFTRLGLEWEIGEAVRRSVRFEQLDLRRDLRFLGVFDLILCRNVLIYFDNTTKNKILQSLRANLTPGGLLALGCAESISTAQGGFRREVFGQSTFYSRSESL